MSEQRFKVGIVGLQPGGSWAARSHVPALRALVADTGETFQTLKVPLSYRSGFPENVIPGNVARNYAKMARDLREGTRTAPSFDDAVAIHRIIAAIEAAAERGVRIKPV